MLYNVLCMHVYGLMTKGRWLCFLYSCCFCSFSFFFFFFLFFFLFFLYWSLTAPTYYIYIYSTLCIYISAHIYTQQHTHKTTLAHGLPPSQEAHLLLERGKKIPKRAIYCALLLLSWPFTPRLHKTNTRPVPGFSLYIFVSMCLSLALLCRPLSFKHANCRSGEWT